MDVKVEANIDATGKTKLDEKMDTMEVDAKVDIKRDAKLNA